MPELVLIVAAVVTAVVVVVTLLFLTPLFEVLPQATRGAVVIVAMQTCAREASRCGWQNQHSAAGHDPTTRMPTGWESQLFRDVDDAEAYTARTRPEVVVAPKNPTREG